MKFKNILNCFLSLSLSFLGIEHKKNERKNKNYREMHRDVSKNINVVFLFVFPSRKYRSRSPVMH